MNKRIYLAGRVTGLNYKRVRKRFMRAEAYLQSIGFEVINPMRIVPEGSSWSDAMRICIHYLSLCNYLALLPGWEQSRGARIEYDIAVGMEDEGRMHAIIHLQEEPQSCELAITTAMLQPEVEAMFMEK